MGIPSQTKLDYKTFSNKPTSKSSRFVGTLSFAVPLVVSSLSAAWTKMTKAHFFSFLILDFVSNQSLVLFLDFLMSASTVPCALILYRPGL